jgi:hypothetical protein
MARALGGRFSRPAFCQRGDFGGEPFWGNIWVEVVGERFLELVMTFMLRITDCVEDLGVAPGAANVFRRAASARFDQGADKGGRALGRGGAQR